MAEIEAHCRMAALTNSGSSATGPIAECLVLAILGAEADISFVAHITSISSYI